MFAVLLFLPRLSLASPGGSPPPNLVMIVADDLGWGDAPWHDPHIQAPRHDSFFGILFYLYTFWYFRADEQHFKIRRSLPTDMKTFIQTIGTCKRGYGPEPELRPAGVGLFWIFICLISTVVCASIIKINEVFACSEPRH